MLPRHLAHRDRDKPLAAAALPSRRLADTNLLPQALSPRKSARARRPSNAKCGQEAPSEDDLSDSAAAVNLAFKKIRNTETYGVEVEGIIAAPLYGALQ